MRMKTKGRPYGRPLVFIRMTVSVGRFDMFFTDVNERPLQSQQAALRIYEAGYFVDDTLF